MNFYKFFDEQGEKIDETVKISHPFIDDKIKTYSINTV